jgi:hypothetical protein
MKRACALAVGVEPTRAYAKIALRSPSRWITFGSHAASECPKVIRELKNRLLSRPLWRAASKPSFGGFIITLLFPIFTGILAYDWLPNEVLWSSLADVLKPETSFATPHMVGMMKRG